MLASSAHVQLEAAKAGNTAGTGSGHYLALPGTIRYCSPNGSAEFNRLMRMSENPILRRQMYRQQRAGSLSH